MKLIGSLLLVIMLSGCAELVGYAIGTLGNVTGDLIMDKVKEKEKDQNKDLITRGNYDTNNCKKIKHPSSINDV